MIFLIEWVEAYSFIHWYQLPQRSVDAIAIKQQLLAQYDMLQSRIKDLKEAAEKEVCSYASCNGCMDSFLFFYQMSLVSWYVEDSPQSFQHRFHDVCWDLSVIGLEKELHMC